MSKKKQDKAKKQSEEAVIDESQQQDEPKIVEALPLTPEQELDEERDKNLRLMADYQNYQKRAAKEVVSAREYANESIMKELLGVLDDMERGLEVAAENHDADDPLLVGMQLVHDKLLDSLKKFGLELIAAEGLVFDPEKHSAMMQEPTDEVPPMTVLKQLQKGYELKGRTLRPAAVIVSKEAE
ncbi:MAG: nucleotide exchange factor GrpE [Phycisphaerae bacterium]|nr:nucleotide exchange factor GrpE [Phycisphaerae bacterium]